MEMIHIENNGAEIVKTNYWGTPHAERGLLYLSINAGAFRLLVPDVQIPEIAEWMYAREIIISRGPWHQMGKQDAIEILFEDYSNTPYVVHMLPEQVDRMPLDSDKDRRGQPPRWKFTVWTRNGKVLELPCRYRIVKHLPCLKKWED